MTIHCLYCRKPGTFRDANDLGELVKAGWFRARENGKDMAHYHIACSAKAGERASERLWRHDMRKLNFGDDR